jgi:hypothetical protein
MARKGMAWLGYIRGKAHPHQMKVCFINMGGYEKAKKTQMVGTEKGKKMIET